MSTVPDEMSTYYDNTAAADPQPPDDAAPPGLAAVPPLAAEPSAAPATLTAEEFWSQTADDDDLPPSLRGKSRREVWDANKRAIVQVHEAGAAKNDAHARLVAQQAINEQLQRQMSAILGAVTQPQQQRSPFGVADPQLLLQQPDHALAAIDMDVQDRITRAQQEMEANQVAPLRQTLFNMQAENAREKARVQLGMDEKTFEQHVPVLSAIMLAHEGDPLIASNWVLAANLYRQQAASLIPKAATPAGSTPPAVGNARPAAAPPPNAPRKATTTGNKRIDAALREQVDDYNTGNAKTPGFKPLVYEDLVESVLADRTIGME